MRVGPLLMSGPMVVATLNDIKHITRRVIVPQPEQNDDGYVTWQDGKCHVDCISWICDQCPYGLPGDLLFVRERMRVLDIQSHGTKVIAIRVKYEADNSESDWITYPDRLKGEPVIGKCLSYGGYREASRITLEITDIRVERVHDISEEDAKAEGVNAGDTIDGRIGPFMATGPAPTAKHAFYDLWNSLNEKRGYGWDVNPWVWVICFKAHKQNVDSYIFGKGSGLLPSTGRPPSQPKPIGWCSVS